MVTFKQKDGWYFDDEYDIFGPYDTKYAAEQAMQAHLKYINQDNVVNNFEKFRYFKEN